MSAKCLALSTDGVALKQSYNLIHVVDVEAASAAYDAEDRFDDELALDAYKCSMLPRHCVVRHALMVRYTPVQQRGPQAVPALWAQYPM